MTDSATFRTKAEKLEPADAMAESAAGGNLSEYRGWFLAEVERGARSAAAGSFATPEQAAAVLARHRRE